MKQYSRVCERGGSGCEIFYNFQMMKANIKDGVKDDRSYQKQDGYGHGCSPDCPVTGTGRLYLGLRGCNTGRSCRLEEKMI